MTARNNGRALPVAAPWYSVRRVTQALTVITEPHVHPFLRANIWHLRGRDRDLVVDTGLGVASLRDELPELFARDPVVVVTHGHLDHAGGAHEFDDCYTHPSERLRHPQPASLNGPALAGLLGLDPASLGGPPPRLLLSAVPAAGYSPGTYRVQPPRNVTALRDGDVIDLGDRQLTALHLPGHSPGSIGLLDEARRALFSGDVVYDLSGGDELLDDIRGADPDAYAASLRRLASLPIDITYPGHGDPLDAEGLAFVIAHQLSRRAASEGRSRDDAMR
jgi:glyoxylase-like metal-dependent hydrolase (beta-lactamase superfamily II)